MIRQLGLARVERPRWAALPFLVSLPAVCSGLLARPAAIRRPAPDRSALLVESWRHHQASLPADDLLTLTGMSPDLALALARRGVRTREDLADQAVDDLDDIAGLSVEEAGRLIMTARAPLFETQR